MRRSTSAAIALGFAIGVSAQPFGRFGYAEVPQAPGFVIDREGFRADFAASDTVRFAAPLTDLKLQEVTDRSAVFTGPVRRGQPQSLRVNLRAPGFELRFPRGFEFRLRSNLAPGLTVPGATYSEGIPTPPTRWVLLTFRDRQPPVLLAFLDGPAQPVLTGRSGEWTLRTRAPYSGVVRVGLPLGHSPLAAVAPGPLGRAAERVQAHEAVWTSHAPVLTDFRIRTEERSLTAVWTFDRPGVLVPYPVTLARPGGYAVRVLTSVRTLDADLPEGPVMVAGEPKLAIEFPIRRLPNGRGLTVGPLSRPFISAASPFDLPSIAELALSQLMGPRDSQVRDAGAATLTEFLRTVAYVREPLTQQEMPYGSDGTGLDLAAAHALLMQCELLAEGKDSEPNSLFTSVVWRRDWLTWALPAADADQARTAAALTALAGALSPEPERRLDAAMLQAGLAAQRAMPLYRQRRGFEPVPLNLGEPLFGMRRGLFLLDPKPEGADPFFMSLMGGVRALGPYAFEASADGSAYSLAWDWAEGQPRQFVLAVRQDVKVAALENLSALTAEESLGLVVVRFEPKGPGRCRVRLTLPAWAPALPRTLAPPRLDAAD